MGKPLKFVSRKSVAVEHPNGGTFHLRPFDSDKALDWYDLAQDFSDAKARESEQYRRMAKFVSEEIVETIAGVVDAETGEPLDVTPEIELVILMDMSDHDVDVPVYERDKAGAIVKVDGKPVQKKDDAGELVTEKKPANEPIFVWALTEAGNLWQKRSAAVKNS